MNQTRFIRATIFLLIAFQGLQSQNYILEENHLKEDFKIALESIAKLSPTLTDSDLTVIESDIEKKLNEFNGKEMNCIEFLKAISNSGIDFKTDEHGNFNLPGEVLMKQLSGNVLFPIPLKIIDSRLFVNSDESKIPFGKEILSINGYTSNEVLTKLTKSNLEDTYELRNIESAFDILFAILIDSKERYEVVYGTNQAISLAGVTLAERDKTYAKRIFPLNSASQKNVINTKYLAKFNTYYFQLNSFEIPSHATTNKGHYNEFKRRFDSVFTDIREKKANHLIIDIRHNRGGDAYIPPLLYTYLARKAFKEELDFSVKTFNLPYIEHLISVADVSNPSEFEAYLSKVKSTFNRSKKNSYINTARDTLIKPNEKRFKGKVYLIVGGNTVSAGAYFAAIFKSQKRGLIYGEKVGGSHRDVTAGNMVTYELPNSKIKLTVPLMRVSYSEKIRQEIPEKFIHPDIHPTSELSIKSFRNKKDVYIKNVFEDILNN